MVLSSHVTAVAATVSAVVLLSAVTSVRAQQAALSGGYKLPNKAQYLALAPKKVHPTQVFQLYITLFSMPFQELTLRAFLSNDDEEYARASEVVTEKGTKRLQLLVPVTATPGKHKLTIQGMIGDTQPIFQNETMLEFDSKYVSLFIMTDRPLYYTSYEPYDTVKFRIAGTTKDLQPVSGPMTIYVKDSLGTIVRRMFQKQLIFGMYEDRFIIPYPTNTGEWQIEVDAFGHTYQQNFTVSEFYLYRIEVNVTCPLYIFNTEAGLEGQVHGQHLSNFWVVGNMTVTLQIRKPDNTFLPGIMNLTYDYVDGPTMFYFPMASIKETFGANVFQNDSTDIFITAYQTDNYWMYTRHGTSVTRVIKDGIKLKMLGPMFRTFKPRVPFTIYIAVTRSDGTPYQGFLNRQIIMSRVHVGRGSKTYPEEKLIIPDDSIVSYTVTPGEGDERIEVRAWHPVTMTQVEMRAYRYWSENNRYISVTTSTVYPKVNEYMVFTVRANFFAEEINYLVLSGGATLLGSSIMMGLSKQKTFSIALSRSMAPRSRLLVYAVVEGEILADSLNFYVQDTRLLNAEISINQGKDFQTDIMEIIGKGTPGAFIAMHGFDYTFYKHGGNTFLTEEKVLRERLTYDAGNEGPFQHTWWYDSPEWEGTVFFTAPTSGLDHLTTFNLSGLAALSDMNLTVTPETHNCNATLGYGRCLSGACFELKYMCDGKVDCTKDGFDELNCPVQELKPSRKSALPDLFLLSRYFQTNDWTWHNTYIKQTGQVEILTEVEESECPFVISAFVLDRDEGLAITTQPAMHDASRLFSMVLEAPTNIKRGEQIGVVLNVFNYWDQKIESLITMRGGDDYRFVLVDDFGWANAYSPRLAAGDIQTMLELPPSSSKRIHFPVVPIIEQGEFTVIFEAFSTIRIDTETVTFSVSYDGIENDDQTPYLIDLVNQGSLIIPDFDIPIPERFFIPNQRELLYIPGSNLVNFLVWGNVVSPGFYEDHLNTANTNGVPEYSADGYIYNVAINLQTLKYLQIVNALDQEKTDKAIAYMKDELPKLYSTMNEDGSFKFYIRSDDKCLWVTSFALQTLHNIHASEWNEDLYVPIETINHIALWITEQQDPETGAFKETSSKIYDRNMDDLSWVDDGQESHQWHIAVTSHVVISLGQATRLTGQAKPAADRAKQRAADYLAGKIQEIHDPFQMAILAYALHIVNHNAKNDAYSRLKSMRRESEFVYWAHREIEPNPTRIVNTVHFLEPRGDFPHNANANMATAYALMLYLAHNEYEASKPIMKWLHTQHNDFMSWAGTKDTLLVLEALTAYAFRETNRDIYQMEIRLESTKDPSWRHTVMLNQSNIAELYQFELPTAWGQIKAYAKGTGYAFLHMQSFHNVEKIWQVAGPDYDAIVWEPENMVCRGRNCSILEMDICVNFVRPDVSMKTGAVFFDMSLPTGYMMTRAHIEHIYNQNVTNLMWAQFNGEVLSVMFDEIYLEKTCFNMVAERWYPVANMSIPHLVMIYEYSETGLHDHTMYETYALFHNSICLVCGSFQCPFCPYYNKAAPLTPLKWTVYVFILPALHFIKSYL